eukprot:2909400-Karenia_brevis.AAC.1
MAFTLGNAFIDTGMPHTEALIMDQNANQTMARNVVMYANRCVTTTRQKDNFESLSFIKLSAFTPW